MQELEELMQNAIPFKQHGYTFDEWLSANDGSKDCFVVWVAHYEKTSLGKMKEIWDTLDSEIKIGLPCTINYWSDRRAATIVSVEYGKTGKNKGLVTKVGVRKNATKCIDYYASDYQILEELEGCVCYYTKRRNKQFVEEGSSVKDPSTTLTLGFRNHYIDPSF